MIIFHEGLPRSGKSFSAIVDHIIPALRAGRRVFSSIEGMNYEEISKFLDISIDELNKLLFQLSPQDFDEKNLGKLFSKFFDDDSKSLLTDSLVVIDEIQDIYPSGKQKLPEAVSNFVAEHGHHGMDILILSQSFKDVHTIWRRRVQTKYVFLKRTAIGRPDSFKWTAQEGQGGEKFQQISSGVRDYEPKYFPLYKSHKDGTENKTHFVDDRVNILKGGLFRFGLPAYAVVLVLVIWFLWHFFHDSDAIVKGVKQPVSVSSEPLHPVQNVQPRPLPLPVMADSVTHRVAGYSDYYVYLQGPDRRFVKLSWKECKSNLVDLPECVYHGFRVDKSTGWVDKRVKRSDSAVASFAESTLPSSVGSSSPVVEPSLPPVSD